MDFAPKLRMPDRITVQAINWPHDKQLTPDTPFNLSFKLRLALILEHKSQKANMLPPHEIFLVVVRKNGDRSKGKELDGLTLHVQRDEREGWMITNGYPTRVLTRHNIRPPTNEDHGDIDTFVGTLLAHQLPSPDTGGPRLDWPGDEEVEGPQIISQSYDIECKDLQIVLSAEVKEAYGDCEIIVGAWFTRPDQVGTRYKMLGVVDHDIDDLPRFKLVEKQQAAVGSGSSPVSGP